MPQKRRKVTDTIEFFYYLGWITFLLYGLSMHSITSQRSTPQALTPPINTSIEESNKTLPKPYHCGDTPYKIKIKEYQELMQLNSDEVKQFLIYQKQFQEYTKHCKP